jgi:hypothetical protein
MTWGERLASYVQARVKDQSVFAAVLAYTVRWLVEEEIPRQIAEAIERERANAQRESSDG